MSCLIKRNNNNNVTEVVVESTGNTSVLYENLASIPFLNQEEAVDMYKNVFSEKFNKDFGDWRNDSEGIPSETTYETGEPKLFFLTPQGKLTTTYKEALDNTTSGTIKAGFIATDDVLSTKDVNLVEVANNDLVVSGNKLNLNNPQSFIKVTEIDSNSNPNNLNGFINKSIREGLLSDTKVRVGDKFLFKGRGKAESLSIYNSVLLVDRALSNLGRESIKRNDDGTLELFDINKDEIELQTKNGSSVESKAELKEKLKEGKFPELNRKFDNFIDTVYSLFREDNDLYEKTTTTDLSDKNTPLNREQLKVSLLNTLSKFGISVTSISNYLEKHNTKHNSDPSIEALADIANNIMAFAEGKDTVENITEETAHFIIEGFQDQSQIEEVLPLVEDTVEWKEHSARYYNKYSEEYSGQELDNIVRREILGKILKNKILDNFNSQNEGQSGITVISTLRNAFNNFVNKLKSFFNLNTKSQLNTLLDTLSESVINEEIHNYYDPNLIKESQFVLFSLNNKKSIVTLRKARQKLEIKLNDLKRSNDVGSSKVQYDLNRLNEAINKNDEWTAIKVITSSVEPQVVQIKEQLQSYKKLNSKNGTSAYFTPEQQNAYNRLVEDFLPLLGELKILVDKELEPIKEVNKEVLSSQISEIITDIVELKGDKDLQVSSDNNAIINRIIDQYNLSEAQRTRLEQLIERDLTETSWFQRNFGSLEHSSNVYLGMLGKIINQNNNKANLELNRDLKEFLKDIDEGNWNIEKLRNLTQKHNGKLSNYLKSARDFAKFEQAEKQARINAYNETFGTKLTEESYDRALKNGKLKRKSSFTTEQSKVYGDYMNKWYEDNTERRYIDKFYEDRKKMYKDLGISDSTVDFLQQNSISRYRILSKYIKPNEELDYSKLSIEERQDITTLARERKAAKSLINGETGERKTGSELRLAEDLQKLDKQYQDNKTDFEIKDSFYTALKKIQEEEGNKAAFEWLKTNGGLIFNDNFWNAFSKDRVSIVDKLERAKEIARQESLDEYEVIEEAQTRLEELMFKKTEILKQYQVPNNPSEIDFDSMRNSTKSVIMEIETELQDLFRQVNTILRKQDEAEIKDNIETENTVNQSYLDAVEDSPKSELEFIQDHITEQDKKRLLKIKDNLENIAKGSTNISGATARFIERLYPDMELTDENILAVISESDTESLLIEYGKTRLLPYFKRFAPQGYDSFIKDLNEGNISVVDLVDKVRNRDNSNLDGDLVDLIDINTQFSWTEDLAGEDLLNPNYDENFEGGFRQPKLSKYLDESFFTEFGVNKDKFLTTGEVFATKNLEDFNMINKLVDIKRKGLEAYNESGSQNVYKVPQVSMGTTEKAKNFVSKNPLQTISNSVKDLVSNRVDDLGHGARIEGEDVRDMSDVRLIPKYYLKNLEEASDVSTEYAHSYAKFLQSAYVYKQRLNTVSDAMVLQQTLIEKASISNLDENQAGIKMFKNFMDAQFFGITRSRKFTVSLPNGKKLDLSKMAMAFDRFVRYVNIGFSLPIAATSLVSAEVFLRIENYVGEYSNPISSKWASKEFAKLTKDFVSEIGDINKTSRMNLLAERFRVFELLENTTSSGFNKIIRTMNNLPYKFSEIANYPIAPRIMLTILDDTRLVGDNFIDYNTFKERSDNQGISPKEVAKKWETHRQNSMYNLLEEKNGIMEFKDDVVERLGKDYLEQQLSRIQARISSVNANVDSVVPQEDKSAATRDFLMNFMTAHRGWLSIAIQRRFKKEHFNFRTGQVEEGHYRTLGKYLKNSFALMEEKNLKEFVKAFKENYNGLNEFEKRNLKRIMIELGVYTFMLGFGIIVAALADDEENKDLWALQFSSYIYFRAVNEMGSVQAPTGAFGLVDTVQAPFIAINSIKDIMDVKGWSFDEVNSGAYKGHSQLYKKLAKQSWLRHLYDLKGVKQKSDFYRLLNSETLFHLSK